MCWKCGKPIDSSTEIFRSSLCDTCGMSLHCCKNCKFYELGRQYDCKETVDEEVSDKEEANFCEYFSVRTTFKKIDGKSEDDEKDKSARDAFKSLFGE